MTKGDMELPVHKKAKHSSLSGYLLFKHISALVSYIFSMILIQYPKIKNSSLHS